jgi:predicted dehydrogenase
MAPSPEARTRVVDVIRWGILGAGGIAATVGEDIQASPGSEIVAVAARDAGRASAFATKFGVPRSYGSYAELVEDSGVDIVYIATTHAQHHEQALLALRAGKPVLIEKAFALNARQAREIVAEARERQLFCMEGMWMRLHPLIRQVPRLIADGRIGDVVGVRADLSRRFEFAPDHRLYDLSAGGGALLDLGVYPTTFAYLVLGRPEVVQAVGSISPTGTDVTAAMQWKFADGRIAQIYASAAGPSPLAALVTGTNGTISVEPRIQRARRLVVTSEAGTELIECDAPPGNGFDLEIAEVERCLRAGLLESELVPLDDSVAILEVLDEARRQLGVRYPADED